MDEIILEEYFIQTEHWKGIRDNKQDKINWHM